MVVGAMGCQGSDGAPSVSTMPNIDHFFCSVSHALLSLSIIVVSSGGASTRRGISIEGFAYLRRCAQRFEIRELPADGATTRLQNAWWYVVFESEEG